MGMNLGYVHVGKVITVLRYFALVLFLIIFGTFHLFNFDFVVIWEEWIKRIAKRHTMTQAFLAISVGL